MATDKLSSHNHTHHHQGQGHDGRICCHSFPSKDKGEGKIEDKEESEAQQDVINIKVPKDYHHDVLKIYEMDCPMEETLIRHALKEFSAIDSLTCNFMRRELHVVHKEDIEAIIQKIKTLDMQPINLATSTSERIIPISLYKRYEIPRLWLSGILAAFAEGFHLLSLSYFWASFFAILSILLVGPTTYKKGWVAIKNRVLNINALMSVAVTGAVILGEFPEAAMVMFLFTLAEIIEARSLHRAQVAVEKLLNITPDYATVIEESEGGEITRSLSVDNLQEGMRLRVFPGERIAVDGVIVKGSSAIDEAPITGESLPVDKAVDDPVYAGSINQNGVLDYRATSDAKHSTIAKIAQTIEEAQNERTPVERFIDRFAAVYTPLVFSLAVGMVFIQPLFGLSWFQSIYNALVVLIIGCPCALVISTPVAIVSALTNLARQGVLVKGGGFLEQGKTIKTLAFDKTGTITKGHPQLHKYQLTEQWEKESIFPYVMTLARHSDHPVSRAISEGYEGPLLTLNNFEAIPGQGTKGVINGRAVALGNARLMESEDISVSQQALPLETLEEEGHSLSLFAIDGELGGVFVVADQLKEESHQVMATLKAMGIQTALVSGNNKRAVASFAKEVGISEAYGGQLPEDKVERIREFKRRGNVGMIGDGINDAPALALADIGFVMGVMGSGVAINTANVTLMDDDLNKIPLFFEGARKAMGVIKQNITLALGIKAAFFIALGFGYSSMLAAVFADVGATLLVVLNSLRLLYQNRDKKIHKSLL